MIFRARSRLGAKGWRSRERTSSRSWRWRVDWKRYPRAGSGMFIHTDRHLAADMVSRTGTWCYGGACDDILLLVQQRSLRQFHAGGMEAATLGG